MTADNRFAQLVAKNLSASTVLKTGNGMVYNVSVITAGAQGALHDCATTGAAAASNQIAAVPAVAGTVVVNMPFFDGLVYVPGAAQVASIGYR